MAGALGEECTVEGELWPISRPHGSATRVALRHHMPGEVFLLALVDDHVRCNGRYIGGYRESLPVPVRLAITVHVPTPWST